MTSSDDDDPLRELLEDLDRLILAGRPIPPELIVEIGALSINSGSVYPEALIAIPYLVRAAVGDEDCAVDVLIFLGGIAASGDERGIPPGSAREEVARHLPLLFPFLDADDYRIRQEAVFVVAQTGRDEAAEALESRWTIEPHPSVRAFLLFASDQLGGEVRRKVASVLDRLGRPDAASVAALVVAARRLPDWSDAMTDLLVSALPASEVLGSNPWTHDPLSEVVSELWRRGLSEQVFSLISRSVSRFSPPIDAPADLAKEVARTALDLGDENPRLRATVLETIGPLADHPSTSKLISRAVARWSRDT